MTILAVYTIVICGLSAGVAVVGDRWIWKDEIQELLDEIGDAR